MQSWNRDWFLTIFLLVQRHKRLVVNHGIVQSFGQWLPPSQTFVSQNLNLQLMFLCSRQTRRLLSFILINFHVHIASIHPRWRGIVSILPSTAILNILIENLKKIPQFNQSDFFFHSKKHCTCDFWVESDGPWGEGWPFCCCCCWNVVAIERSVAKRGSACMPFSSMCLTAVVIIRSTSDWFIGLAGGVPGRNSDNINDIFRVDLGGGKGTTNADNDGNKLWKKMLSLGQMACHYSLIVLWAAERDETFWVVSVDGARTISRQLLTGFVDDIELVMQLC